MRLLGDTGHLAIDGDVVVGSPSSVGVAGVDGATYIRASEAAELAKTKWSKGNHK